MSFEFCYQHRNPYSRWFRHSQEYLTVGSCFSFRSNWQRPLTAET